MATRTRTVVDDVPLHELMTEIARVLADGNVRIKPAIRALLRKQRITAELGDIELALHRLEVRGIVTRPRKAAQITEAGKARLQQPTDHGI